MNSYKGHEQPLCHPSGAFELAKTSRAAFAETNWLEQKSPDEPVRLVSFFKPKSDQSGAMSSVGCVLALKVSMKSIFRAHEIGELIFDGASLLVGGFLGVGCPDHVVDVLVKKGVKNLTLITNDTARPGVGVGKLIDAHLVKKLFASHIGTNPETQRQMLSGELDVELVPQGTLIERIRCGGFGLGGVLTKTGLGTLVAETKRKIEIDGEEWLLDTPIKADFALIHAHRADFLGNLTYHLTADNFNSVMAMAGATVIADVDEFVAIGEITPDAVRTPGVLVDYILDRRQ